MYKDKYKWYANVVVEKYFKSFTEVKSFLSTLTYCFGWYLAFALYRHKQEVRNTYSTSEQ